MSDLTDRLQALSDNTTPGGWEAEETIHEGIWLVTTLDKDPRTVTAICETGFDRPLTNAQFIVAARNLWQPILAVIAQCVQCGRCALCGAWLDERSHAESCAYAALERAVEEASK